MSTLDQTTVEKRVEAKLGFYNHVTVYLIVMAALLAINLMTTPHNLWFLWPLIGWGVAILFHLFGVFVFGKDTRLYHRMMKREMHEQP
jgi:hypothetical protein